MKLPYRHHASAALLAMAFGSAGSTEAIVTFEIRWGDQPVSALRTLVAPASSTRWCGAMRKGDNVGWEFDSAEPLDMAVLTQEGRSTIYFVTLDALTGAAGALQVDADQVYC